MSDRTPILITLFETCACAAPAPSAAAIASETRVRCIAFILLPPKFRRPDAARRRDSLSVRSDAEIVVELGHVGVKVRIGDHVDHATMVHYVVAVRDRRREPEILLDEQDRETLRLEARDRAPDLLDDDRCQALGGLVEEQKPRARAQDAADREHLL